MDDLGAAERAQCGKRRAGKERESQRVVREVAVRQRVQRGPDVQEGAVEQDDLDVAVGVQVHGGLVAESLDLAGTSTRHGRRERLAMRGREHHHMVAEGGLGGRQGADDVGEPAGLGERHYFRREVRDPQRHRQTPLKAVESLEPRVES